MYRLDIDYYWNNGFIVGLIIGIVIGLILGVNY